MHEVEIKAVLKDKEAFIAALAAKGCVLGSVIRQDDTVYVRELGSLQTYLHNAEFLRLRVEDSGRVLFTFKRHPGRETNLDSAPLELEVEVSSRDTTERIITLMGYQEAMRIKKERRKGVYEKWEICVDEVEGLGSFVEFEELIEANENIREIQTRMEAFIAKLGIGEEDYLKDRYDVLMLRKNGIS